MDFDAIVAGAGIWGCTVARRLAEAGKRVLVLERRPVVVLTHEAKTADVEAALAEIKGSGVIGADPVKLRMI